LGILFSVIALPVMADDCLQFKFKPKITVVQPKAIKNITQPEQPMDLWHGNVIATFVDNYDIVTDIKKVDNGYCIVLKNVNATVGYKDFLVNIDIRHTLDSCPYNAVLKHEEMHINAYLSVINDFMGDLKQSVFSAADSVMPVFVKNKDDIDTAIDMMNSELQAHPEVVLVKQKIKAAEEIRNKKIDQNNDGADLKKCFL
jgi:hypothetical protein